MKLYKYAIAAAVATLALTSCSSDEPSAPVQNGGNVTLTFQLPGAPESRAFGDGLQATSLTCLVYNHDTKAYVTTVTGTFVNLNATASFTLTNGVNYDIVCWGQAPGLAGYKIFDVDHYVEVDYAALAGNSETPDAFWTVYNTGVINGTLNPANPIILKRPMAQLNIGTSDWNTPAVKDAYQQGILTQVKTTAYKHMDLLTGLVRTPVPVSNRVMVPAGVKYAERFPVKGYGYLSMQYLLVGQTEATADPKSTFDCKLSFFNGDNTNPALSSINVPAVPFMRNYKTNIYGGDPSMSTDDDNMGGGIGLLTSGATLHIQIDPMFNNPDNNEKIDR